MLYVFDILSIKFLTTNVNDLNSIFNIQSKNIIILIYKLKTTKFHLVKEIIRISMQYLLKKLFNWIYYKD